MNKESGVRIRDILEYLRESRKNGSIKSTTATPMIIAINRLVGETYDGDGDWRELEVDSINVEKNLHIFKEKTKSAPLAERSYKSYRARYLQAIKTYSERLKSVEKDRNRPKDDASLKKESLNLKDFAKTLIDNEEMNFFPIIVNSGIGVITLPKNTPLSELRGFFSWMIKYIDKKQEGANDDLKTK